MSEAENGEQQEPTMEEILASIRRIISEDEVEGDGGDENVTDENDAVDMDNLGDFDTEELDASTSLADLENAEVEEIAQDDIDDIMNTVDDDAEIADTEDVLELTEVVEEPVSDLDKPIEEIKDHEIDVFDALPEPDPPPPIDGSELVSDQPASETSSVFSQYTDALAMARGIPIGNPNKSVEDIVKELLRPMLREWLDDNLPALVERLVEREINRLAGQGEKD